MTRFYLFLFVVSFCPAAAQTVTDITLPTPFLPPTLTFGIAAPVFGDSSSMALAVADRIHLWSGLPTSPSYTGIPLTGAQRMVTSWTQIAKDTAIYRSVGADLSNATADDELILVRGLPGAPQLVPTGIFGVWSGGFEYLNSGAAVALGASGLLLLRHNATGATLQTINIPLVIQPSFGGGRIDADTVAALGPGPDTIPGTMDDELVLVRGLSGPGPYAVETHPLPLPGAPTRSLVTEDGVLVVLRELSLPNVEVHVVQAAGSGVPPLVQTLTINTGASNVIPGSFYSMSASKTPGGGLAIGSNDDLGTGHVLLGGLRATPTIRWSWYDYFSGSSQTWPVHENEIVTYLPASPADPVDRFVFGRNDGSGPQAVTVPLTTTASFPPLHSTPVRLSRGALTFAYNESGAFGPCRVASLRDPFVTNVMSTTPPIIAYQARVFPLGPGLVAELLSTNIGNYTPNLLRIVSLPHAVTEEFTHPATSAPIQLSYTPAIPSIAQTFQVGVLLGPSLTATSANLVFALDRLPEAVAVPGVAGLVAIDQNTIVGDFTVPLIAPGTGHFVIAANSVPPAIIGTPFYLQSYAIDAGGIHLSDLGLIVLGP